MSFSFHYPAPFISNMDLSLNFIFIFIILELDCILLPLFFGRGIMVLLFAKMCIRRVIFNLIKISWK